MLDKKNETCIEDKREQRQQKESMSYRGQSKMESHGREKIRAKNKREQNCKGKQDKIKTKIRKNKRNCQNKGPNQKILNYISTDLKM